MVWVRSSSQYVVALRDNWCAQVWDKLKFSINRKKSSYESDQYKDKVEVCRFSCRQCLINEAMKKSYLRMGHSSGFQIFQPKSIENYMYIYIQIYNLEKAMAPHSSTLAWKIPWMEEPGRLQSMGSLRVGHDWATSLSLFTFMHWRRKWQPTPVFLPGESQGRGSLVGCHLWGHTESDTTEAT